MKMKDFVWAEKEGILASMTNTAMTRDELMEKLAALLPGFKQE